MEKPFSLAERARSFRYAFSGLAELLRSQHNARVHLFASLLVVIVGLSLGVTRMEWCALLLAMMLVWIAEALNTALEFLCNLVSPDFHPLIKKSKDVAAASVLISAAGAVVIGILIFLPYLLTWG
ncbi:MULTISPECIES: diacylglycerol kinase family protein [Spongiibacter]|uniref:diacylglycerol kinase family protein n=1 Tax=Spongiibacter TaxID=630749 RepID=UPI001B1F8154|nr:MULTISPECIES: diacylglycerol kinase family protein [Spongiibacter]MBO6754095.1 diacylglycerol kinase family protein [Spongiibacter sp.]|tara:strand:+ start:6519 stop:6893 length:375 start_codon:yes stop_codon:yes gene_type:complete